MLRIDIASSCVTELYVLPMAPQNTFQSIFGWVKVFLEGLNGGCTCRISVQISLLCRPSIKILDAVNLS